MQENLVDTFEQESVELERTIEKILQFPNEVTRPCHIPLSGVSSIPAQFVHTNEFIISEDDHSLSLNLVVESYLISLTSRNKLRSHTESADVLRERIKRIKDQIREIDMGKKTDIRSVGKSFKDGASNVFEIRQFVDENGRELHSELIDIKKQMNDAGDLFEKAQKNKQKQRSQNKTKESNNDLDPLNLLRNELEAFQVGSLDSRVTHGDVDPETAFSYEMHATVNSDNLDKGNVEEPGDANLSFFDDLERQEKNYIKGQIAETQRNKKEDENSFGKAFKSGFLSRDKSARGSKEQSRKAEKPSALKDSVVERM